LRKVPLSLKNRRSRQGDYQQDWLQELALGARHHRLVSKVTVTRGQLPPSFRRRTVPAMTSLATPIFRVVFTNAPVKFRAWLGMLSGTVAAESRPKWSYGSYPTSIPSPGLNGTPCQAGSADKARCQVSRTHSSHLPWAFASHHTQGNPRRTRRH